MTFDNLFPSGFKSLSVPTFRASTITYGDYATYRDRGKRPRSSYSYGLAGTPTTRVLQAKLSEMESAVDTFLVGSGLSAITTTFLALCHSGDTVALPDNVYPPLRRFANDSLSRLGIKTFYYDPRHPNVHLDQLDCARILWCESPGSMTHEVTSFKALREQADRLGAMLGADNSWASPFLCKPIDFGIDIVVEALSKHLSGHSDLLMGSISVANEEWARAVYEGGIRALGVGVSPDDCFLALRGLETAQLRIKETGAKALEIAQELTKLSAVKEVLFPSLTCSPDFELYRSQFKGPGSVLTISVPDFEDADFDRILGELKHFSLGPSWGGTHSIFAPSVLDKERSIDRGHCGDRLIRFGIGLEDKTALLDNLMCALGKP